VPGLDHRPHDAYLASSSFLGIYLLRVSQIPARELWLISMSVAPHFAGCGWARSTHKPGGVPDDPANRIKCGCSARDLSPLSRPAWTEVDSALTHRRFPYNDHRNTTAQGLPALAPSVNPRLARCSTPGNPTVSRKFTRRAVLLPCPSCPPSPARQRRACELRDTAPRAMRTRVLQAVAICTNDPRRSMASNRHQLSRRTTARAGPSPR